MPSNHESDPLPDAAPVGDILVASEGHGGSLGALRLAVRLSERDGCRVRVMAVAEPPPTHVPGSVLGPGYSELMQQAADGLRDRVARQLREVGGGADAWEVSVVTGPVLRVLARAIAAAPPDLILLGLGRKHPFDRLLGSDVAPGVARVSVAPLLAVPGDVSELPRKAVVGTDFSGLSRTAAARAADLVGPGGDLHLVHVLDLRLEGEWADAYRRSARERLEELGAEVERTRGLAPTLHLVGGEAADTLLELARKEEAGLVATGSHGHSFFTRLLLGSVSRKVLRGAERPVLVVPPAIPPDLTSEETRPGADAEERSTDAEPPRPGREEVPS